MNANQLWAGSDYAHSTYLRRGDRWTENASRVRVVKVRQVRGFGAQKASTVVDVWFVDEETEDILYDGNTREVRARDIFMRWEEYADERDRRRSVREQRLVQEAKERAEVARKRDELYERLEKVGFRREGIVSVYDEYISINRAELERWLNER